MSKKIVILNGSPRKNGNTSALVRAFTEGAEHAGHTVTEFFLNDMTIHGCRGCFGGHSSRECPCVQKDDMREWTFENDNGRNPQAGIARRYVEHWEDMRADNIGCLFWGGVGTGKSYLAGCIANALMAKEIPVHMTNFALILNDLAASLENRNEYISRLCRYPLLILDDFGMERGHGYGLEQGFHVIDSRYRSGKPLIVTTNLTLDELRNPEDTAHSRIYDRLLSMCVPVRFTGDNFRQETAQRKMESMKKLITD